MCGKVEMDKLTKRGKRVVALGLLLMALGFNSIALAQARSHTYDAIVKCAGMAEDSAAHVRLTQFKHNDDGTYTLVYRCKHLGY